MSACQQQVRDAAPSTRFSIGGVSVAVSDSRGRTVPLVPALEQFRDVSGSSNINIRVEWVRSLPPASHPCLFDSGTTWRLQSCDTGFQFDFRAPAFGEGAYKRLLVDDGFRIASLQMSEERFLGLSQVPEPLDYPLDELLIMHRLTQEKAIELHGTGMVRANGEANLFVGHSGAGKSTTTRMWTALENVEVLSDDRIIVRRDSEASGVETPCDAGYAPSMRGVLRSAPDDKKYKMRMYGTPWHGEAMFASPNSAPLTRVFVLEHGQGNVVTLLSPSQAVAELFARSFVPFHRHEYVDSALEFLQELVHAVPVYHYAFEPDQRAVDKIRNFHD